MVWPTSAYAEYTVAPANYVAVLPEGLSYEEAAPILCAGVTTYKGRVSHMTTTATINTTMKHHFLDDAGLKETEARPGQWCVLFGMGGLGHVGLQYAKAMGLNTIAVDISDQALELAKTLGADIVINAAQQDPGRTPLPSLTHSQFIAGEEAMLMINQSINYTHRLDDCRQSDLEGSGWCPWLSGHCRLAKSLSGEQHCILCRYHCYRICSSHSVSTHFSSKHCPL